MVGQAGVSLGSSDSGRRQQAAAAAAAGRGLHAAAAVQMLHRNARSGSGDCTSQNKHMARMPHLPLHEMPL